MDTLLHTENFTLHTKSCTMHTSSKNWKHLLSAPFSAKSAQGETIRSDTNWSSGQIFDTPIFMRGTLHTTQFQLQIRFFSWERVTLSWKEKFFFLNRWFKNLLWEWSLWDCSFLQTETFQTETAPALSDMGAAAECVCDYTGISEIIREQWSEIRDQISKIRGHRCPSM